MVRGTPGVKRDRTISVRVSAVEWAAWEARRAASGRREMGAWVRAVVLDAEGLGQAGSAAGDVPVVPEVNEQAYAVLVGAANNLNQLTRYSHQEEALAAGMEMAVAEVVAAARAVRGRSVTTAVTTAATKVVSEPVSRLTNESVAESVPEQEAADQQAHQSGVQVDPWVSRPRRCAERSAPAADAGADLGPTAGEGAAGEGPAGGPAGGGASPLTPQGVEQAAQEDGRPAGWDVISLAERARWVQR